MNWAGVQRLPVVFVLENNQYAYSTPLAKQFAVDPVERARVYGFPGVTVDGNDAEAVFEAVRAARARALAGEGPTLVEAVTMRMHGHAAHDDMRYVPSELLAEWAQRDPIERQERRVAALGVDVHALRAEVDAEVEVAASEALAAPMPDPADAAHGAFAVGEAQPLGDGRAPWSGFAAEVAV
jgi:pyruvate dehydrogenase E1 component alpha subunit